MTQRRRQTLDALWSWLGVVLRVFGLDVASDARLGSVRRAFVSRVLSTDWIALLGATRTIYPVYLTRHVRRPFSVAAEWGGLESTGESHVL